MSIPAIPDLTNHPVVHRDAWLAARKELFAREKALTHERDAVSAARRALPWVKVDQNYVFQGPDGPVTLAELFDGRRQLIIYHFMFAPGAAEGCPGCSFICDHVDAARQHFEQAGASFAAVSRAPFAEIAPFKRRMGWSFTWVSSNSGDFNYDHGVSFTPEQVASGKVPYNYGESDAWGEEAHGTSVFYKDEAGGIFHTYSCYSRGDETMIGAFMFLDLVPLGRNEESTMSWLRHHDRYEKAATAACCGGR
jgi:predicted dithiol-disulfide oxidoreductase (DUF899 family)